MANNTTQRQDPIRENHFKPLERMEWLSGYIFYISAVLSFAPLAIDSKEHPAIYQTTLILFSIAVMLFAISGLVSRFYLTPRAEDERRKEFLSTALDVELTHERTVGYYNNNEQDTFRRLSLMVLENAFFTKRILLAMAPSARLRFGIYLACWIAACLWRGTSLDWIVAATQVVFGEEIIARWIRIEWERMRVEQIYESFRLAFQANPTRQRLQAYALDATIKYESTKAIAGVLLSAKLFEKLNPSLTQEWERIKAGL